MPKCSVSCCCCIRSSTKSDEIKTKHLLLKHFHHWCALFTLIILAALLIAATLWLIVRIPDPTVRLTGFELGAIANNASNPNSTLIRYNVTVHNPDLYKSLDYDVLVLFVTFQELSYGFAVNLDETGEGYHQRPGEKTLIPLNTANATSSEQFWDPSLSPLLLQPSRGFYVLARVIVGFKCRIFNRVIARRQSTKSTQVYFNTTGSAFLNHPFGLKLN